MTNEAALQRSVDMASRMAGWAGRVVERVLKEHRQVTLGPVDLLVLCLCRDFRFSSLQKLILSFEGKLLGVSVGYIFQRKRS